MIILDEIKQEDNISHSTFVTYPKTIQISHGVYDNVVDMHNMCMMISQNVNESTITNVYGGRTEWGFFNNKPEFTRFINYVVDKHKNVNFFFSKENWITKDICFETWGNELKNEDYVGMHVHPWYHIILYLTEGAPLVLPELKMTIIPKKGHYYVFPPYISHGVNKISNEKITRYCLVANLKEVPDWERKKLIEDKINAK